MSDIPHPRSRHWRQAAESLDSAQKRLHEIQGVQKRNRAQCEQAKANLQHARAELTALLGAIYIQHRNAGKTSDEIAEIALLSIDDLWALLSASYQVTDDTWLQRAASGLAAGEPPEALLTVQENVQAVCEAGIWLQRNETYRSELAQQKAMAEAELLDATETMARFQTSDEPHAAPRREPGAVGQAASTDIVQQHKPDPLRARGPADFMSMLRQFRVWAGNPSLRELAGRAQGGTSYSTFSNLLRSETVPKRFRQVEDFIRAAGGNDDDVQVWLSAWRRIAMNVVGVPEDPNPPP